MHKKLSPKEKLRIEIIMLQHHSLPILWGFARTTLRLKSLLSLASVWSKTTLNTGGVGLGGPSNLKNVVKSGNFCLTVSPKAPFYWKLFKICMRSAKDIRKDVLIFQV